MIEKGLTVKELYGSLESLTTEEILQYSKELIQMKGKCETCTLRKDNDDGMNITSYCMMIEKTVDKLTSKCHLSKDDQEELDGKYLVKEIRIE